MCIYMHMLMRPWLHTLCMSVEYVHMCRRAHPCTCMSHVLIARYCRHLRKSPIIGVDRPKA